MNPIPFLVSNRPVITREAADVMAPFDGRLLARVCVAGENEIASALDAAEQAFSSVRKISSSARSELLREIGDEIGRRSDEFVERLVSEAGKPVVLAEAEVQRTRTTFAIAAAEALLFRDSPLAMEATAAGAGHRGIVRRFPLGIILGITPFNFPLNLAAHKIAPCIATGNTMILKPSPKAPLSALLLGEVLAACGVPPGQIVIMPFDPAYVNSLLGDSRVKMLTFTGGDRVGWKLKAAAVRQRVALELGGNAACIVEPDSEWEAHIPKMVAGAFGFAGQSCIGVQRIYVHRDIYDRFRSAFLARTKSSARAGDPRDPQTLVGPMIDSAAVERIAGWIRAAEAGGARLLLPLKIEGRVVHPVVIENAPHDAAILREEAFAPVVSLLPYETFADALASANDSRFGLQTGVFTTNINRAFQAFETLDVGGVLINQVPTFRVENMPYGGVKDSGFGREGVRCAMEEMTELKSLIINGSIV